MEMNIPSLINADNSMDWTASEVYEEHRANRPSVIHETQNDCIEIISNKHDNMMPDNMRFELVFRVWSEDLEELLARAAKVMNDGNSDALHIITDKDGKVTIVKT